MANEMGAIIRYVVTSELPRAAEGSHEEHPSASEHASIAQPAESDPNEDSHHPDLDEIPRLPDAADAGTGDIDFGGESSDESADEPDTYYRETCAESQRGTRRHEMETLGEQSAPDCDVWSSASLQAACMLVFQLLDLFDELRRARVDLLIHTQRLLHKQSDTSLGTMPRIIHIFPLKISYRYYRIFQK